MKVLHLSDFVLKDFLPYQLAVLAGRISAEFADLYRDKFDISVPEWRVVAHLSTDKKISVREIFHRVDMDKSKVSRAADRLVARGYVIKRQNPRDKRLIELSLTAKGRDMLNEIGDIAARYQAGVLTGMAPETARQFELGLRSLLERTNVDNAV